MIDDRLLLSDKLFLSTWEQMVEYKKVHEFGRDFNLNKRTKTAQEIIDGN